MTTLKISVHQWRHSRLLFSTAWRWKQWWRLIICKQQLRQWIWWNWHRCSS